MNPTPPPHDDGLEWLRDVRSRMLRQADGDFKKLGDRYRAVQSRHPEKTFDPHATIIRAVREKQSGQR